MKMPNLVWYRRIADVASSLSPSSQKRPKLLRVLSKVIIAYVVQGQLTRDIGSVYINHNYETYDNTEPSKLNNNKTNRRKYNNGLLTFFQRGIILQA